MVDPLSPLLEAGETLLWHGQIDRRLYLKQVVSKLLLKITLVNIFIIGSIAILDRHHLASTLPIFCFFALLWVVSLVGLVWASGKDTRDTFYGITNRRILIVNPTMPTGDSSNNSKLSQIDIAHLKDVTIKSPSGDAGTLQFGTPPNALSFRCIAGVRDVQRLVQGSLTQAPPQAVQDYPSDWLSNPFADKLESGEAILWLGKPQQAPFMKSYLLSYLMMLLPVIVVSGIFFVLIHAATIVALEFGILLICSPLFYKSAVQAAQNTYYAVTNQRILILASRGVNSPQLLQQPLSQAECKLTEKQGQIGTIDFMPTSALGGFLALSAGSQAPLEWKFRSISDAQNVYETIQKARQAAATGKANGA